MAQTLAEALSALSPTDQARVVGTLNAGDALQKLLADPEMARAVLPLLDKAAKKANPAHVTVEEQAQPFIERALAEVDKKLAARDKKTDEDQAVANLNAKIAAAKANRYTDEGIKNILTLMQETATSDFEIAVREYEHRNPKLAATPAGATDRMDWNFYDEIQGGDLKSFFDGTATKSPSLTDDPEKWQRAAALKYLNGDLPLPTG